MKKTKSIAVIFIAVFLLSMTACVKAGGYDDIGTSGTEDTRQTTAVGKNDNASVSSASAENMPQQTTAGAQQTAGEEQQTNTTEQQTEDTSNLIPDIHIVPYSFPKSEALDFVRSLRIGWNLGNTFDAVECTWVNDELKYESAWNGAVTTEKHIDMLKEAGFNAVRIPVSWHNHLTDNTSYTISGKWLDRVTEAVDYCIDRDMYVIINIHHDNSKEYLYPSYEYLDQSTAYVTAIWTQLAEHFKDYDEHLIFDGMNEPRLVGHNNEWWIDDSQDCVDAIECINVLNQVFVDTVRASGGNNVTRYLMCPGYDASPDGVLNDGYVIPRDIEGNDNRIIVSVHAYTPYNFALQEGGTDKWSSSNRQDVADMVWFMDALYNKYVCKGIPVIIDEFGAVNRNGNIKARVDFAAYYIAATRARGMTCFWWDNNAMEGDGELFGLLDRNKNEWKYRQIVDAMMKYAD